MSGRPGDRLVPRSGPRIATWACSPVRLAEQDFDLCATGGKDSHVLPAGPVDIAGARAPPATTLEWCRRRGPAGCLPRSFSPVCCTPAPAPVPGPSGKAVAVGSGPPQCGRDALRGTRGLTRPRPDDGAACHLRSSIQFRQVAWNQASTSRTSAAPLPRSASNGKLGLRLTAFSGRLILDTLFSRFSSSRRISS